MLSSVLRLIKEIFAPNFLLLLSDVDGAMKILQCPGQGLRLFRIPGPREFLWTLAKRILSARTYCFPCTFHNVSVFEDVDVSETSLL